MSTRGTTSQGNPIITNREASGLILFARAAAAYGRDHGAPALTFDNWYQLALWTLGWIAPGDKFLMSEEHQLSTTAPHDQLWQAAGDIARKLDDAHVPLAIGAVGSPAGTEQTYKKLATDAWQVMQSADAARAAVTSPPTDGVVRPVAEAARKSKDKDKGSGIGIGGAAVALLLLLAFSDDDNRKRRSY